MINIIDKMNSLTQPNQDYNWQRNITTKYQQREARIKCSSLIGCWVARIIHGLITDFNPHYIVYTPVTLTDARNDGGWSSEHLFQTIVFKMLVFAKVHSVFTDNHWMVSFKTVLEHLWKEIILENGSKELLKGKNQSMTFSWVEKTEELWCDSWWMSSFNICYLLHSGHELVVLSINRSGSFRSIFPRRHSLIHDIQF